MTPPSGTRRSQRAERREAVTRLLLDEVERQLALGRSFGEMTVDELAAAAAVSPSTFYVYFEDKGELLRAWFSGIVEEINTGAGAWWGLKEGVRLPDVRQALDEIFAAYRPHLALMAATFDAAEYDPGVRESTQAMMAAHHAGLRRHIRRGQREGFIGSDLHADETAAWLTWMAERCLHKTLLNSDEAEVQRLLDGFSQVIWHVLYAHA